MALDTTEEQVKAVMGCMKRYSNKLLARITTSAAKIPESTSTSITLSNNIKDIQTKLDKMKKFANTDTEVV